MRAVGKQPLGLTSEATEEAQFSESKGPSFSLMLADLEVPNAYIAHVERLSC